MPIDPKAPPRTDPDPTASTSTRPARTSRTSTRRTLPSSAEGAGPVFRACVEWVARPFGPGVAAEVLRGLVGFQKRDLHQVRGVQLGPEAGRDLQLGQQPQVVPKMLQLQTHDEVVAHLLRTAQSLLKNVAWIACVRLVVRLIDIANHARNRAIRILLDSPGQHRPGARIRVGHHIAFIEPREAFNGRTVEAHTLFQRVLKRLGMLEKMRASHFTV